MDELLRQLEIRIKTLLKRCDELNGVNTDLEQSNSMITHEKNALLVKNKLAITQIEQIISRLKSIESVTDDE